MSKEMDEKIKGLQYAVERAEQDLRDAKAKLLEAQTCVAAGHDWSDPSLQTVTVSEGVWIENEDAQWGEARGRWSTPPVERRMYRRTCERCGLHEDRPPIQMNPFEQ